jgi:hypothetical protein
MIGNFSFKSASFHKDFVVKGAQQTKLTLKAKSNSGDIGMVNTKFTFIFTQFPSTHSPNLCCYFVKVIRKLRVDSRRLRPKMCTVHSLFGLLQEKKVPPCRPCDVWQSKRKQHWRLNMHQYKVVDQC